jgi:predicted enzyme related to lactoylglutathione lyase
MTNVSVRYIVEDVIASIEFYVTHLGFTLEQDARPAFASVTREGLRLLLSGQGSSGARPMPDGRRPAPGGWNRILLTVSDIEVEADRLRTSGLSFRNEILKGVGGSQILLDDPSGNPIELFQPAH